MATPARPTDPAVAGHLNDAGREVLRAVIAKLESIDHWTAPSISGKLKETVAERGAKMPQVMMPFRVALTGQAQTPAIDAIAAALRKDVVLRRLDRAASG
jgi:glutamyl-tRNA synthetase